MSNDNTTLADVQPGGRVRLGEQALSTSEGARRYVADFFATEMRRHDFGDYILTELAADFACALAQHLSAQPSPGGQGALAMVRANLRSISDLASNAGGDRVVLANINCEVTHALQLLDLAARQPVGVDDATDRALGETIEQRDRCEEVADELADHIARITGVDIGEHSSANCPWQNAIEAAEEYKPAQAVDLGDFKALYRAYVRLLESGRDRIMDLGGTCDPVDVMEANDVDLQAARRVLDSQAVGNG